MDPETSERFSLQAAIAMGITAFLGWALLCLAPLEFLRSLENSSPAMPAIDGTPIVAFALMVAIFAALATGLLTFGSWRILLLPEGRLGFFPGALVGAVVAALVTTSFVFFGAEPVGEWTGMTAAEGSFTPAAALLFGIGLSIPAALLSGVVAGVVCSSQLQEVLASDSERPTARRDPRDDARGGRW